MKKQQRNSSAKTNSGTKHTDLFMSMVNIWEKRNSSAQKRNSGTKTRNSRTKHCSVFVPLFYNKPMEKTDQWYKYGTVVKNGTVVQKTMFVFLFRCFV